MAVLETKYSIAQEAVAQRQVEEVRSLDVANRKLRELENEESRMVMKLRTTQMQQRFQFHLAILAEVLPVR